MKIQVSKATANQLNWLVAKIEGHEWRCPWMLEENGFASWQSYEESWGNPTPEYSTDPCAAYAIIEREKIETIVWKDGWSADYWRKEESIAQDGDTIFIAAMRCYVANKLGVEVEIPENLV